MATDQHEDQFEMVFAPAKYGALDGDKIGRWSILSSADGTPLGVAWADGADAAGFIQAGPGDLSEEVWRDFAVGASLNVPAMATYQIARRKTGVVAEEEKTGRLQDVYKELSKLLDRQSVITAAAELEQAEEIPTDAHVYLTVADDDENRVLELVRSDETGMYIRDNKDWVPIDIDADNDRVWDRIIVDVTLQATNVYDTAVEQGAVTADMFNDVRAPEEEIQQ